MCEPFIRNHQFNLIRKQTDILLNALRTVSDRGVLASVTSSAEASIMQQFADATDEQRSLLAALTTLNTAEDFKRYLDSLLPYRTEFPRVTKDQIRKLFPKSKKLKIPDLSAYDYRSLTYLSWIDIATGRLFIVYPLSGRLTGIEGKFIPASRKNYCFVCNRYEELVLFSAVGKIRPAQASADYYKAVGNYLCASGHECNRNIADVEPLEKFIRAIVE